MDKPNAIKKLALPKRLVLAGAMSLAALLSSGCSTLTPANQKLRELPDKLEGAAKIEKYEVPGAKYCLVHIKQEHYGSPSNFYNWKDVSENDKKETIEYTRKMISEVNKTQRDISSILSELENKLGVSEVMSEGATKELSLDDAKNNFDSVFAGLVRTGCLEKGEIAKYAYLPGAVIHKKIFGEPEFRILPAEDPELSASLNKRRYTTTKNLSIPFDNEKLSKLSDEERTALANKILEESEGDVKLYSDIVEPRENAVLDIAARQGKPLNIVVYGTIHDWSNNIAEWNAKNPDKKFSHVVIFPSTLYNREYKNE